MQLASRDAKPRSSVTAANVNGSVLLTPKSRLFNTRVYGVGSDESEEFARA